MEKSVHTGMSVEIPSLAASDFCLSPAVSLQVDIEMFGCKQYLLLLCLSMLVDRWILLAANAFLSPAVLICYSHYYQVDCLISSCAICVISKPNLVQQMKYMDSGCAVHCTHSGTKD